MRKIDNFSEFFLENFEILTILIFVRVCTIWYDTPVLIYDSLTIISILKSQGVLQPGEPGIIREFENGSGKPGNMREFSKNF